PRTKAMRPAWLWGLPRRKPGNRELRNMGSPFKKLLAANKLAPAIEPGARKTAQVQIFLPLRLFLILRLKHINAGAELRGNSVFQLQRVGNAGARLERRSVFGDLLEFRFWQAQRRRRVGGDFHAKREFAVFDLPRGGDLAIHAVYG